MQSPPYFDTEDNTIGGSLTFTGVQTCWLVSLKNTMADPDAGEVLANRIDGSIACFSNSPAVQYGDSGSSPNQVRGAAFGECD